MKEKNLRQRLTTTLFLSMIYLFGKRLILPWVARPKTPEAISGLREFIASTMGDEAQTVNLFSLGIMPYMTASILFMLFRSIFRQNARVISQTKVDKSMAVAALVIAVIQAVIRVMDLKLDVPKAYYLQMQILTGVVFVIGAAIVIMISEINKKNGVGYFSVFILINILSAMVINVLYSEKSIDAIVKLGIPGD